MLVDKILEDKFRMYSWCLSSKGYAVTHDNAQHKHLYAHRLVFRDTAFEGELREVHHVNCNGLDNRLMNLIPIKRNSRYGKGLQNRVNNRDVSGVEKFGEGRWKARWMGLDGQRRYSCTFDNPEEAHRVYKEVKAGLVEDLEILVVNEWKSV
jgi:hypothetical protein